MRPKVVTTASKKNSATARASAIAWAGGSLIAWALVPAKKLSAQKGRSDV